MDTALDVEYVRAYRGLLYEVQGAVNILDLVLSRMTAIHYGEENVQMLLALRNGLKAILKEAEGE